MIIYGISIIVSLLIGLTIGYNLSKGEKPVGNLVETINNGIIKPVKEIKEENIANKKAKKEMDNLTIIARNVDNYRGNGIGQKKV